MLLEEFRADGQAALSTQSDWMLRECDIATSNQNYHFLLRVPFRYCRMTCICVWIALAHGLLYLLNSLHVPDSDIRGICDTWEKHLWHLATCKDCAARVEEHEVRLGVARSKMDTQALLGMAQHGSAWLSMAQHGSACCGFRPFSVHMGFSLCFFFRKKKQGFDEQPLDIDRTKGNIRWNFVFLTQSAICIGFRDRRRCQASQMLAPNHETVTRLTKGSGAAMLCRARISCWLHWAIVWSYKVQCT